MESEDALRSASEGDLARARWQQGIPRHDIKGGVAVTYHDANREYGAIGTYTQFDELNGIIEKVIHNPGFRPLTDIMVSSYSYHFTEQLHKDHPDAASRLSKGHAYDLKSNVFTRLPDIFLDTKPDDGFDYIQIYGRDNNARAYKYIRADYVEEVPNLFKWKIFVPKANGSGALGEVMTTPVIGHTESFVSIGLCDTRDEAEAILKYVKSKFARCMLGVLKVTQDNPPEKWAYVPLQNFTPSSDIDWTASIPEIDRQLYSKYGLDRSEIDFIESHVKPME